MIRLHPELLQDPAAVLALLQRLVSARHDRVAFNLALDTEQKAARTQPAIAALLSELVALRSDRPRLREAMLTVKQAATRALEQQPRAV